MIAPIAAALLALLPLEDGQKPAPPDAARVKETVAALDKALASPKPEERKAAVEAAAGVVHADVIARVGKALADKETVVRAAAIESLRFMDHPAALDALQGLLKRDADVAKDDELGPALYRAIGQHASPSSIALLADAPLGVLSPKADRARVLSLGNIRSPKSVEALFQLMQSLGHYRARPFMNDFRLALAALTGEDRGESHEEWVAWWNEHKKKIVLPETRPELPPLLEIRWRSFWNSDKANQEALKKAFGDEGKGKKDPKGGETPPAKDGGGSGSA